VADSIRARTTPAFIITLSDVSSTSYAAFSAVIVDRARPRIPQITRIEVSVGGARRRQLKKRPLSAFAAARFF
jgi:hypothetical protein